MMEVFGGVLTRGLVTATDVSAGETQSQMYPLPVGFEAFLAACRRAWQHVMNLVQMPASCCHNCFSSMRNKLHTQRYGFPASLELVIKGRTAGLAPSKA